MSVKGWEGDLRVGETIANAEDSGSDEPAIQSISPKHGAGVEALYKMGSQKPVELKEGNIEVSLDITINYQGDTTWSARAGVGAADKTALTEFYVGIYPKGAVATRPELRILGKFTSWDLDISQDGVATESVTLIGKLIAVGAAFIG